MNRSLALFFFMIFLSTSSFSQFRLDIEITEIRNNTGNIMLQLFDGNEKVVTEDQGPIKDNKCTFSIPNLSPGKYAIRYYHDENLSGKMEKNPLGRPTEGYGFSNNVIGKFGPPAFEKWLFDLSEDKKIILKPTY
jgi:uncharacterized protein (DUF2141 family)